MKSSSVVKGLVLALAALMLLPVAAFATWPGANGKIFFGCHPTGGSSGIADICSINPDGSGFANLTNTPSLTESAPEVSPDGAQVVYTQGASAASRVWVMNADGSNAHQITTFQSDGPTWTPGGNIAFRGTPDTVNWEFQTVAPSGGPTTTLFTAGVSPSAYPPRFTGGGVFLYARLTNIPPDNLTQSQQIYKVTGGVESPVTLPQTGLTGNQQPSWSPDGSKILFQRLAGGTNHDVWVVPSGGGTEVQVTNTAIPVKETSPSFSPDGSKLVWDQEDATHDFFHKQLVIANADGSSPIPIATPSAIDWASNPFWATNGSSAPPSPIAAFDATAPKKLKKGKPVPVTLRCIGDTQCVVTYSALVTVPGKSKKVKTFKLKSKTVTIAAKTNKTVRLTLSSKANAAISKALKAGKKPVVKITATAHQPNNGPLIRKLTPSVRITS